MVTAISQTDPRMVAIKAELLHGIPELTGTQINRAAFLAVVAINRLNETSKEHVITTIDPIDVARTYDKGLSEWR